MPQLYRVGNLILTALAILASDSHNPLAWCNFHSPGKMPPLTAKNICHLSQTIPFFRLLIITEAQLIMKKILKDLKTKEDCSQGTLVSKQFLFQDEYL